jgi:hypothetical protein
MELNYRFFSKPRKVLHALGHMHKPAGFQCFSIFFIEGAPHPDVKRPGYNSDVFIVAVGHFEGKSFAEALDRAIARSQSPNVINPPTIIEHSPDELKGPMPRLIDRRF